jgi:chromosomal replication initiation ATPase DnaA
VARAIEAELRAVAGTPLRVRIDVDQSLGGALRSLGVPLAPLPPAPPALQVRPENRLAAEAMQRLARELRPEFDQLHLEGPEGTGKSLLIETLLWQRRRRHPLERWRRERGHDFFRSFSAACLDGQRGAFRGNVVACDALLFDDLQELSGKLVCQETLLEIVQYLRARGRPVVIASRPLEGGPREFLPQLVSFLRQGLRLALPQLSAHARAAILGARVASQRGTLAALSLELAEATDVPLGKAVAALDAAARRAAELGRMPTRAEVDAEVRAFVPHVGAAEPYDRVLDRCAGFVGVSREELVAGTRTRAAALGRHLAIYLAFEVFALQRATVRRWLGALSPSVEPYARQKIEALRATDRRLDGFLREVAEEIGRGQRFLFG